MDLSEFLLACIAEDETAAEAAQDVRVSFRHGLEATLVIARAFTAQRVLAECEAKRRIVEWHQNWPVFAETAPTSEPVEGLDVDRMTIRMSKQIAWLTEQEYRARFGDEPPTSPILLMLAQPYAAHPDFREEWKV